MQISSFVDREPRCTRTISFTKVRPFTTFPSVTGNSYWLEGKICRSFYGRMQQEVGQEIEAWWRESDKAMDAEEEELEQDGDGWEELIFMGPFSIPSLLLSREQKQHGGSRVGKITNRDRRREKGAIDLWNDYFCEEPVYDELMFRRRYRMSSRLFNRILKDIVSHDSYFALKHDAAGKPGLSPHQKLTAAMRQLAYGVGADAMDEYCRLAESTALESLYRFVKGVRELYEERYLRKPNAADFQRQLSINKERGFPGMFGSLDCMHWQWKNCPVAWQGQYTNKDRQKSLILEAVADKELWFWHVFFGLAGGNNDLNVLDRSPLLNEWIQNDSANVTFTVNGVQYKRAYLLVDNIYPEWSMFINTIHAPTTDKLKLFAACQESVRKDVERAFGVLQARFEIVRRPARSWYEKQIINILTACTILHNMIIEDERGDATPPYLGVGAPNVRRAPMPWLQFLSATSEINNKINHHRLRNDIIDHLWQLKGSGFVPDV